MLGPFRICNMATNIRVWTNSEYNVQVAISNLKSTQSLSRKSSNTKRYVSLCQFSNSSKSKRLKHLNVGHTCDVLQGGRSYQSWHRVGPEWPQKRVNFWRIFFAPIFGRNFFAPMFGVILRVCPPSNEHSAVDVIEVWVPWSRLRGASTPSAS